VTTQKRIRTIAEQAVSLGVPPADTPLFAVDVNFGRQHSLKIWDAISDIRAGKDPDHSLPNTKGPSKLDHTVPHAPSEPECSDVDDAADDALEADRECPECHGSGRDEDGGLCERCHGTGRVSSDDDTDEGEDDDRNENDDDQSGDADDADDDRPIRRRNGCPYRE
jgi:hypothetical protein